MTMQLLKYVLLRKQGQLLLSTSWDPPGNNVDQQICWTLSVIFTSDHSELPSACAGWIRLFKAHSMFLSHEDSCYNPRSVKKILQGFKDCSLWQYPSYTFFSIYSYIFTLLHWKRMNISAAISVTVTNTEPSSVKEFCSLFSASPDAAAKNYYYPEQHKPWVHFPS